MSLGRHMPDEKKKGDAVCIPLLRYSNYVYFIHICVDKCVCSVYNIGIRR